MGTTLTGTTPQDTYDSLIKVTDNGPLSGTAKYLSDGLGNDSALAVSTSKVGVSTNAPTANLTVGPNPVSQLAGIELFQLGRTGDAFMTITDGTGRSIFGTTAGLPFVGAYSNTDFTLRTDNSERMRITATGNVGIGTNTPARPLSVAGIGKFTRTLTLGANDGTTSFGVYMANEAFASNADTTQFTIGTASGSNIPIIFATNAAERVRVTDNGLTFNGDTAAANALDDYEEGTWTPSVAFGGASVGVVLSVANGATYTKIGRQVTVNGFFAITSKGSSTGAATITGLPFTIGNGAQFYAAASLFTESISFVNVLQGRGDNNTTTIQLFEVTEAGVLTTITNADFTDTSNINLSLTYFV